MSAKNRTSPYIPVNINITRHQKKLVEQYHLTLSSLLRDLLQGYLEALQNGTV